MTIALCVGYGVSDLGNQKRTAGSLTKFEMGDGEIVGRYKLIEIYDTFFNRKQYSRPD